MSYVYFRNAVGRIVLSEVAPTESYGGVLTVIPVCALYEGKQVGRRIGGKAFITIREAVPTQDGPVYGPLPADPRYSEGSWL